MALLLRSRLFVHGASSGLLCSRRRVATELCFTTESGDEESGASNSSNATPKVSISTPFPWRHSSDPLPRLADGDDLSGLPNNARARFVRKMLAARELGAPWWQIFISKGWESELAENFTWAFRRAVAGVLSKSFRVPMDRIDDDEEGIIRIDTTTPITDSTEMSQAEKDETDELVDAMLEENLRILYSQIDPSATQIKLTVRPISWQFESAFLIPMFTRDHVKKDISLKGAYQEMEQEFTRSGSIEKVQEMGNKLAKDSGFSGQRSLIAEVSVSCMETFQILDATTGEIVQGSEENEEKETLHLVRMEMVTTRKGQGERKLGQWQIIDWDDHLEGNVWH